MARRKANINFRAQRDSGAPAAQNTCAILARVSTGAQAGEDKVSIPTQLADCRALAAQKGFVVLSEYVDDKPFRVGRRMVDPSGTRADRPRFKQMLADGYAGRFRHIIAWKVDRLYRGVKAAVPLGDLLEATGIQVHTVKDHFDFKTMYIMAAVGKLELDSIKERVKMGARGKFDRGLPNAILPWGYKRVRDERGDITGFVIQEEFRPWFTELARQFLDGVSIKRLADTFPRPADPYWAKMAQETYHKRLYAILRNKWYRGIIRWNDLEKVGQHPPMWDEQTCARIAAECARRVEALPAIRSDAPFTSWLRCGICGAPMHVSARYVARPYSANTADRNQRLYSCQRYRQRLNRRGPEGVGVGHPPNNIADTIIKDQLMRMMESLTETDVRAAVEQMHTVSLPGVTSQRADLLQAEIDSLQSEVDEHSESLIFIKNERTRNLVKTQIAEGLKLIALKSAELADSEAVVALIDTDLVIQRMLALAKDRKNIFKLPDAELGERLRAAIPIMFAANGYIAFAQADLPARRWQLTDVRRVVLERARVILEAEGLQPAEVVFPIVLRLIERIMAEPDVPAEQADWWLNYNQNQRNVLRADWYRLVGTDGRAVAQRGRGSRKASLDSGIVNGMFVKPKPKPRR